MRACAKRRRKAELQLERGSAGQCAAWGGSAVCVCGA